MLLNLYILYISFVISCISLSQYNLYISFVVSCISLSQSVADNEDYDVDNQEGALDVIESLDF